MRLMEGQRLISRDEFEEVLFIRAVRVRVEVILEELPPCPFYEAPSKHPDAVCGVDRCWISGSDDTRRYCEKDYLECLRYMGKMGIKDKEIKRVEEEYYKELFGEDYVDLNQKFKFEYIGGEKNARTGNRIRYIAGYRIYRLR